ncbi:MAG: PAS domain-containing protein [Spirochaetes bacterium]|nr:PAS domain-containing protein [Spirochaetota bacterium]
MIKATNIGLWDMEMVSGDPSDPNNEFTFSDEFRRLLGFNDETDFPNKFKSQVDCMHPQDRAHVLEVFRKHVLDRTGQSPYDLEYRMIKKNGEIGYFRDVGETTRDTDGNPLHTAGALMDVTEKWKAAIAKEEQLTKNNIMVRAAGLGMWEMHICSRSSNMYFEFADDLRKMLGYKNETDFPNDAYSIGNVTHPDDYERVTEALSGHIFDKAGQTPYSIEYRIKKNTGEYIHIHDSADTLRDADGNPIYTVGAFRDITETKNLMLENEQRLNILNMAVRATKIGLWYTEVLEGPISIENNSFSYSEEFRRLLGYEGKEDFPDTFQSLASSLHPDDAEMSAAAFNNHLKDTSGNTLFDIECRMIKKNGDVAYYRATADTSRDKNGNPVRSVGATQDITWMKTLIMELDKQRREAERANLAKSAFLSTMSHEIRTPMNAILGITEIQLQKSDLDQGNREAYEKIYTSGDLLLSIINDILDLSKIEAGKLELINLKYEVASLLSDTAQLNMMRIGSKPIEFELHVDEDMPTHLIGDELRIKQILSNLLSNAFKYTESGMVKMIVGVAAGKNAGEEILTLTISDTGQGMTKEQVDQLFDKYARFNLEANRAKEGVGLGMNITRNLVLLMGGHINVESTPGKGSVFEVHLTQRSCGADKMGKELAESLRQFRSSSRAQMKRVQISREPMPYGKVLIVDDVETNIYVARGLMVPYELEIDSASSGVSAIEKIKSGQVYDIIFMDHMMPLMDGIETTKRIRAMGYDKPIVALTANAISGQEKMFLSSGFNDYISKPIDIRQLNFVLNKLVRDKYPEEAEKVRQREQKPNDPLSNLDAEKPAADTKLAELFARDAVKILSILEDLFEKGISPGSEELRTYTIHVHGLKSALANIGETNLSGLAGELEDACREEKIKLINAETPVFLKNVREFIAKTAPSADASVEESEEDRNFLQEKFEVIKAACKEYDDVAVENALCELKTKRWSRPTHELLLTISDHLLMGSFDEIMETLEKR